jgi:hypothetical protein
LPDIIDNRWGCVDTIGNVLEDIGFNFGSSSMEKPTSFAADILPLFTPLDIQNIALFGSWIDDGYPA